MTPAGGKRSRGRHPGAAASATLLRGGRGALRHRTPSPPLRSPGAPAGRRGVGGQGVAVASGRSAVTLGSPGARPGPGGTRRPLMLGVALGFVALHRREPSPDGHRSSPLLEKIQQSDGVKLASRTVNLRTNLNSFYITSPLITAYYSQFTYLFFFFAKSM